MSKTGNVGQSSYSASKAALNILTQSLSDEIQKKYKLHNFTINAISPGIIDTKMAHEVPERVRDMCLKQIPMNRFGKAEEIAQDYTAMGHSVEVINSIIDGSKMSNDEAADKQSEYQRERNQLPVAGCRGVV